MTLYILGAFFLSIVCGLIFTPLILDFCKRKKLYDLPNERKVHKNAIPRLGGISFFPSMLIASLLALMFVPTSEEYTIPINLWTAVFSIGMLVIYGIGIIDDLVGLNAVTKFFFQIITATILAYTNLRINNLYGLFGVYEIPQYIGLPLTIFLIVFIDNAINLIDGIDGLAACLSLIALSGFLAYFLYHGVYLNTYCILIAGMIGALVAFCYFNLFGKPEYNTKIFMGDSGSLSLGFLLGFLTIKCAMNYPNSWPLRPEAIIVPFTLLFVPTADVIRVTLHRLCNHKPLFVADKNHIHHKLMRTGLTQHQTLVVILMFSLFYIGINSLLYLLLSATYSVIIDIIIYCIVNICINSKMKNAE
jgi:UDP-N-acetylmuramyl pentapeptide phosphotransferase/UDP-N-acetylglucosamine-1-phosphate transferase